ncbi:LuxR C-terminal-related transcriptional regulator [Nocardia shimofusensis]|uniref:LuxR C-terminal-related transcriptional regulator n=1 Tax=Nocardia shimofusensis TaxID=228596 RepID=UPI00082BCAA2|nr:LuxR C-terminal-related transcriptional regulator [Nocardia shimofusensis]
MSTSHHPGPAGYPREPTLSFTPIARPLLFDVLDAAVAADNSRVLLLSAPAGTGKTVLVADWAAHRPGLTVHWARAAELRAAPPDLPSRGVLIVEDAHLLADPEATAEFERLLLDAPPDRTVIVCARHDPPIRWHLLELRARLNRLGAAELAFTAGESARLCGEHGVRLDDAGLATVTGLTRGWAALVRILAVHLAAHPEELEAPALLERPPHPVAGYLAAELLDDLTPALRAFLTVTGVPLAFTEKLADELAGGGAGHYLDELDRIGFPLTRTARGTDVWIQHHPMLRACFRAEADRLGTARITELHTAAAHWLHAAGHLPEALAHLGAAGDRRELLDFVVTAGLTMVLDGNGRALFDELTRAAVEVMDDPYLWALRVLDALVHGDLADAGAYLDLAVARGAHRESFAPAAWTEALIGALAVDVAACTGAPPVAFTPAATSTGNPDIDCYTDIQAATAAVLAGRIAEGEELLHRGSALAEHACHPRLVLRTATRLALAAATAQSTSAMRRRAARALAVAADHDLLASFDAAQVMTIAAAAAYLRGEAPEPSYLTAALAWHRDRDGAHSPLVGGHGHLLGQLARLGTQSVHGAGAAGGPTPGAVVDTLHRDMLALLDRDDHPLYTAALVPHVVWALLRMREPRTARLLTDKARSRLGELPDVTLARAACALAEDKPRQALDSLEPLLCAQDALRPNSRVTARLVCAVAHFALGRPRAGAETLERAVHEAADGEIARPFLDVPGAIALLDACSGRFARAEAFVARIRANPAAHRDIFRPALTDTELLVLKQLPTGRTVGQIATDLGVSINTVKTHLRGIYGKLGANSRVGALDTARRSGLL